MIDGSGAQHLEIKVGVPRLEWVECPGDLVNRSFTRESALRMFQAGADPLRLRGWMDSGEL
jgi:hypothetical protein